MIKKFDLGAKPLDYIKEQLSYGNTIATYILEVLRMTEFSFETYLPDDTLDEKLIQYNEGGIVSTERAYYQVAGVVVDYIKHLDYTAYSIFQTPYLLGMPVLDKSHPSYFSCGLEIHDFLDNSQTTQADMYQALRFESFYPATGIIVAQSTVELKHKMNVSKEELQLLAHSTQYLLVGSYDNESWLIGVKK